MGERGTPHIVEHDLTAGRWAKSSRSGSVGTSCVEIAVRATAVSVRDSKARAARLRFGEGAWHAFLGYVTS